MEERRQSNIEHYEKILDRFSHLESKLDVFITRQEGQCLNHRKETEILLSKVSGVSHIVCGNGEPGIAEICRKNTDEIKTIKEQKKARDTKVWAIMMAVIALAIKELWGSLSHLGK